MVDFTKRLESQLQSLPTNPIEIYGRLDRASDKGPLRAVQTEILESWLENHADKRDTILKLHTGQGKTLVGLLILQSLLNANPGKRAIYICPNKHLVSQTVKQATQFGLKTCEIVADLPSDFLDGKSILVTHAQKMFNGRTKFGLGPQSVSVDFLVMDDAHACVDVLRDSAVISISSSNDAYGKLRDLFEVGLAEQGVGTFEKIKHGDYASVLPVPYWDWLENEQEVAKILNQHSGSDEIKFPLELLKDQLSHCQCFFSGTRAEISPYLPPIHVYGSFKHAKNRIFMSATVTNDAFLVKGLGLSSEVISQSLRLASERWSGEKMVIIPSLIDETLDRQSLVPYFANLESANFGIVGLVPSNKKAEYWASNGAVVATAESLSSNVESLSSRASHNTLAIVNRYDGIDLPDDTCRVLILDSKPHSQNLADQHAQNCRASSRITAVKTARSIEQGMGRAVRGEKDYCAIVCVDDQLVRVLVSGESRKYLSEQTRRQVEIGLEVAQLAKEELMSGSGSDPNNVLKGLLKQLIGRDNGWKAYYTEQMNKIMPNEADNSVLELFEVEAGAEKKFQQGNVDGAIGEIQGLLDRDVLDEYDIGWYLQEIARYRHATDSTESNKTQVAAYNLNGFLLRPRFGTSPRKIALLSEARIDNIVNRVRRHPGYESLMSEISDILSSLRFGVRANRFENAFYELGLALGFESDRPEKTMKKGSDNLWAMNESHYLLAECKSEVELFRSSIYKKEAQQIDTSIQIIKETYPNTNLLKVLIIPTNVLANDAAFIDTEIRIMRNRELNSLVSNVRAFFREFEGKDFQSLSKPAISELITTHKLRSEDFKDSYTTGFRSSN